LMRRY